MPWLGFHADLPTQECRHHRPRGYALRGWHVPPRPAVRGAVPQQATRRQVYQQDVPSQCLRHRRALLGHPAEPLEPDLRRGCHPDQHSEVCRPLLADDRLYANPSFLFTSLLNDPNTSSPANVEASNLYKDNRKEYIKRVRETVEASWED